MTIGRRLGSATMRKVSDVVRSMVPHMRQSLTADEERVALHLRGNENLYEGLKAIVEERLKGRARMPEPSDPLICKSMMARDRELQWFLSRLEFIYRSPLSQAEDGEPPE